MIRKLTKLVAIAGIPLMLSGCSSVFGINLATLFHKSSPATRTASTATALTELGRRQLNEGQTGQAIESFQLALMSGEPSGPAYNGLGVGYARLGMFEKAQKGFNLAISVDPDNQIYQANLSHLMLSPALALRHEGDTAISNLATSNPTNASSAPREIEKVGKLTRVSANEFHISIVPPNAAEKDARSGTGAMASRSVTTLVVFKSKDSSSGSNVAPVGSTDSNLPGTGISTQAKPNQ